MSVMPCFEMTNALNIKSGLVTHKSIKSEPPGVGTGALVVLKDSQVTSVCHQG